MYCLIGQTDHDDCRESNISAQSLCSPVARDAAHLPPAVKERSGRSFNRGADVIDRRPLIHCRCIPARRLSTVSCCRYTQCPAKQSVHSAICRWSGGRAMFSKGTMHTPSSSHSVCMIIIGPAPLQPGQLLGLDHRHHCWQEQVLTPT